MYPSLSSFISQILATILNLDDFHQWSLDTPNCPMVGLPVFDQRWMTMSKSAWAEENQTKFEGFDLAEFYAMEFSRSSTMFWSCLEMRELKHPKWFNKQLKIWGSTERWRLNCWFWRNYSSTWTAENGGFELCTNERLQSKYNERIIVASASGTLREYPLNNLSEISFRISS